MTTLISPRVRKVIGKRRILMIGFRISSNMAKIKATFMIVSILGVKERFLQISFSMTSAKAIKRVYLRILFMYLFGNNYTACCQNNKAENNGDTKIY